MLSINERQETKCLPTVMGKFVVIFLCDFFIFVIYARTLYEDALQLICGFPVLAYIP